MRTLRSLIVLLAALAAAALLSASVSAAEADCVVEDQSTDEVLPGVTLTWDSSFLCANADTDGSYEIPVTVSNDGSSVEAVTIDSIALSHTTPRPRGIGPQATADAAGLPVTIAPGGSETFDVTGSYELVTTDEGDKANLHLRALGTGVTSLDGFELGINVQLRGEGAEEDSGSDEDGGPPPWAGGPPPWAGPPAEVSPGSARR